MFVKDETQFIQPFGVDLDLENGIMLDATHRLERRYLCLKGEGFMMMKTPEGEWKTEKMVKGRMVYVPAYWAHRSINTGDTPLISFCVYPGDAGHNYGDIIEDGFPARVFLRDKEIIIEEEQ